MRSISEHKVSRLLARARAAGPAVTLGSIMDPKANSFGVLRLVMALLVLVSHAYLYTHGTPDAEPLYAWTGHSLGEHAVQVFFILSGILVAQSFERSRSILDFATARILRIFPALTVCVVMTAFVLGPVVSRLSFADYAASPGLLAYILKTLSLSTGNAPLPGVFETNALANSVNTSLWTLKYEVLCYIGLAFAGVSGMFDLRWRHVSVMALAGFIAVIFATEPKDPGTYGFTDNIRYFVEFFGTGVLTYLVKDKLSIRGTVLLPLFAVFVAAIGSRFGELATALFLAYATIWLASKSWGPLRGLCNKLDLSFGVYIYAGPIEQALIWAYPNLPALAIAGLALVLTLPLALLSWVLIEWPALRLRSLLSRKAATDFVGAAASHHGLTALV